MTDAAVQAKIIIAAVAGFVFSLFGGASPLLSSVFVLMLIDILSGLLAAWIRRELSSEKMADGGKRKGATLLVVLLGAQVGPLLGADWLRDAVLVYYVVQESLSILENVVRCGVPVPAFLIRVLKQAGELAENPQDTKPEKRRKGARADG